MTNPAPFDPNTLITSLLTNVVAPNLIAWWQSRHAQGLPPPTEEEAIAHLHGSAAQWLAENADNIAAAKRLIAEEQ